MRKNIFLILISFLIISCSDMESVIDLEIPPHDPVLVLNGVLDTDSTIKVCVSHSAGSFTNAVPSFIRDANILIYEDDIFVDTLFADLNDLQNIYVLDNNYNEIMFSMYYYKSTYTPLPNSNYRIEVSHPDYNNISAETYIESGVNLYDINIDSISNLDKINFKFSFDDNINKQNYYRLKLFASCDKFDDDWWYEENEVPDNDKYRGTVEMQSNDPSFPQTEIIPENGYTFIGEQVVFSDALFNGQKKTISIDVDTYFKFDDCDTITIEFSTFSNDTYSYFNSLGDHRDKGELGIFGGEVIPVYTNVNNGLGVLISINSQQFFIKPAQVK